VRTPMQWSNERNAGFSTARRDRLSVPVVSSGPFGYRSVNVAEQERDPSSLLAWFERAVVARAEVPGFGNGTWEDVETGTERVMALRFHHADQQTVTVHNLSGRKRRVRVDGVRGGWDVFGNRRYGVPPADEVEVDAYGYRWLRLPSG
jgi:maltose alpha-D-glucosyltransferase / alpha-amylase